VYNRGRTYSSMRAVTLSRYAGEVDREDAVTAGGVLVGDGADAGDDADRRGIEFRVGLPFNLVDEMPDWVGHRSHPRELEPAHDHVADLDRVSIRQRVVQS